MNTNQNELILSQVIQSIQINGIYRLGNGIENSFTADMNDLSQSTIDSIIYDLDCARFQHNNSVMGMEYNNKFFQIKKGVK